MKKKQKTQTEGTENVHHVHQVHREPPTPEVLARYLEGELRVGQ
jgi:hypothetical protein